MLHHLILNSFLTHPARIIRSTKKGRASRPAPLVMSPFLIANYRYWASAPVISVSVSRGTLRLPYDRPDIQSQPLGNAASVRRIGLIKVLDLQFLDTHRHLLQVAHNIADEPLFRVRRHQPEQFARLRVVVRIASVIVPRHGPAHHLWPLHVPLVLCRSAEAVRFVVHGRSAVPVEPHRAILVVGVHGTLRLVYR